MRRPRATLSLTGKWKDREPIGPAQDTLALDRRPTRASGVTEQPSVPRPRSCRESEEKTPAPGGPPAPGALSIAPPVGSSSQVPSHCTKPAQLLGSQEQGGTSAPPQPAGSQGEEGPELGVDSVSQSDRSLPWPVATRTSASRAQEPGVCARAGPPGWGPQHTQTAAHMCAVVCVVFCVLWGSRGFSPLENVQRNVPSLSCP